MLEDNFYIGCSIQLVSNGYKDNEERMFENIPFYIVNFSYNLRLFSMASGENTEKSVINKEFYNYVHVITKS